MVKSFRDKPFDYWAREEKTLIKWMPVYAQLEEKRRMKRDYSMPGARPQTKPQARRLRADTLVARLMFDIQGYPRAFLGDRAVRLGSSKASISDAVCNLRRQGDVEGVTAPGKTWQAGTLTLTEKGLQRLAEAV